MGKYENASNWKLKGLVNDKRIDNIENNINIKNEEIIINKNLKINNNNGLVLISENGTEFKLTISNEGSLNILNLSITEGGDSSTTTFDIVLDNGDSSTTIFEEVLDGGNSL